MGNSQIKSVSPDIKRLVSHISEGNPKGVVKLAAKNGDQTPVDSSERQQFLYSYIAEHGNDALHDLSLLHPDRQLVLSTQDHNGFSFEGHKECSTCNKVAVPEKQISNADGSVPVASKNGIFVSKDNIMNAIIIALLIVIIYLIASKKHGICRD